MPKLNPITICWNIHERKLNTSLPLVWDSANSDPDLSPIRFCSSGFVCLGIKFNWACCGWGRSVDYPGCRRDVQTGPSGPTHSALGTAAEWIIHTFWPGVTTILITSISRRRFPAVYKNGCWEIPLLIARFSSPAEWHSLTLVFSASLYSE